MPLADNWVTCIYCPYSPNSPYRATTIQYLVQKWNLCHKILWCRVVNVVTDEVLNGIIGEEFLHFSV